MEEAEINEYVRQLLATSCRRLWGGASHPLVTDGFTCEYLGMMFFLSWDLLKIVYFVDLLLVVFIYIYIYIYI